MSGSSQQKAGKHKPESAYITVSAYFKDEFGGKRFIKGNGKDPFRNEAQRKRIMDKNLRWFRKNQHRLKAMIMYQHPGNFIIWRWPEKKDREALTLWLKYKPEHAIYPVSAMGIWKETRRCSEPEEAFRIIWDMAARVDREIAEGKLWLARIYRHPGNTLYFEWSEEKGELRPGSLLESVALL
ncbi:MAG: hypothetical protein MRZ79_00020 [Bacteroidia bacterium]|nr:hypothetical protein [Bacteroidia bacterium]